MSETIGASIRSQLRSIVRLVWDLRKPAISTEALDRSEAPNWVIPLEPGASWSGVGLRLGGLRALSVPDEKVIDKGYELAGHIYHLKDRLHQLARATGARSKSKDNPLHVAKVVETNLELKVCGDLVNLKKHGRHQNQSKLNPSIGNVVYDTAACDPVEVQYDGARKATALLVTNPHPISFRIELLSKGQLWRESVLDTMIERAADFRTRR